MNIVQSYKKIQDSNKLQTKNESWKEYEFQWKQVVTAGTEISKTRSFNATKWVTKTANLKDNKVTYTKS